MALSTVSTKHFLITISLIILSFVGGSLWFMMPPLITKGEVIPEITPDTQNKRGRHVVVNLTTMTLDLRNGSTTIKTLPIISQGKPGSYYETIGGEHINDYKTPLHFSSIGHVYMPYSVHVFGNYFIHGIPYYPNGEEVSSTYSGGCIRLSNEDAKTVYTFIERGMPIIITRDTENSFNSTKIASTTLSSSIMTNLMVVTISLESLTQDNEIIGVTGALTTRRNSISRLLTEGDSSVALMYARSIGQDNFIDLMNQKAKALGLTNTHFVDVTSPVETTYDDYARFMNYISTYKSYLASYK